MKPYPGPTGIRSHGYNGFAGCTYCGFCGWTGCWTGAKASTNLHYIPQAEKTGNLKVVSMARVTEVNVDKNGRASGVTYLKGGKEYFQPAKVVMLATYMYENVRLHAALEVEGVSERPLQQPRAGRQALHGPRARVGVVSWACSPAGG